MLYLTFLGTLNIHRVIQNSSTVLKEVTGRSFGAEKGNKFFTDLPPCRMGETRNVYEVSLGKLFRAPKMKQKCNIKMDYSNWSGYEGGR